MRTLWTLVAALGAAAAGWLAGDVVGERLVRAEPGPGPDRRVAGGPWRFSAAVGRPAASALERARFAVSGPLGLSASEAVYFTARADTAGQPLSSACDYRITGEPLDTRWWSLTVYDADSYDYVAGHDGRASWTSRADAIRGEDPWVIHVGPAPGDGPWLSSRAEPGGTLELLLRVYNPSDRLREALPAIPLPVIERTRCR